MDMYRRNTWKDWWEDVGFIYAIAIALVVAVFVFSDFAQTLGGLPGDPTPAAQTSLYPY
ncbi:MAG: hypothetical protein ACI906_005346 [Candidatus Latescibacterota bacterium]|jgi:hypothetical protein